MQVIPRHTAIDHHVYEVSSPCQYLYLRKLLVWERYGAMARKAAHFICYTLDFLLTAKSPP